MGSARHLYESFDFCTQSGGMGGWTMPTHHDEGRRTNLVPSLWIPQLSSREEAALRSGRQW